MRSCGRSNKKEVSNFFFCRFFLPFDGNEDPAGGDFAKDMARLVIRIRINAVVCEKIASHGVGARGVERGRDN